MNNLGNVLPVLSLYSRKRKMSTTKYSKEIKRLLSEEIMDMAWSIPHTTPPPLFRMPLGLRRKPLDAFKQYTGQGSSLIPLLFTTELLMQSSAISLNYLNNKPKRIYWTVVCPSSYRLSVLQDSDLIYDDKDLKIRGLDIKYKDL